MNVGVAADRGKGWIGSGLFCIKTAAVEDQAMDASILLSANGRKMLLQVYRGNGDARRRRRRRLAVAQTIVCRRLVVAGGDREMVDSVPSGAWPPRSM